ncbi:MAG: 2OG-Fe(II) oxygenase [Rhodovibrionaceae bacterium]
MTPGQAENAASERRRGRPLEPGDRAPPLQLRNGQGLMVSPGDDAHAGRAAVLIFAELPGAAAPLSALLKRLSLGEAARLFIVVRQGSMGEAASPGSIWLQDSDGEAAAAFGFAAASLGCAVIDANSRLLALLDGVAQVQAPAIDAALRETTRAGGASGLANHPPVLLLPRVLSPQDCARLIAEWEKPVRTWQSDGFTSAGYDSERTSFKVQVDSHGQLEQLVLRDPVLEQWLDSRFARRIRMEIRKVFHHQLPMREDYRIVCYDARKGGYLGPHRDNPNAQTRHRLFTAVVALNDAADYEGGTLAFPEYAPGGYRLAAGTAVVWSTSLLHEVQPLHAGRRVVLGTHLGA